MRQILSMIHRVDACETERKLRSHRCRPRGVPSPTRARYGLALVAPVMVAFVVALAQPHAEAVATGQREAGQMQTSAAPGEEEHAERGVDALARIVNFAILAGTLFYLLRSPLRKYLVDRGTAIRSDLVNASEMKRAAAEQIEEIDRRMKALPRELEELRAQGAQEIATEEARIQGAAAAERERLLVQARREIDLQVKVAERDLIVFAADLAVGVASERIKKNISDDDQKHLIDRYVQQLRPS